MCALSAGRRIRQVTLLDPRNDSLRSDSFVVNIVDGPLLVSPRHTKCPRYLGKCHDKVMELRLLGGRDDLVGADFPRVVAVLDVLLDAAVKQDGLLGHDANLGAQEGHVDAGRVVAINQLQEVIDLTIKRKQYNTQRLEIQSTQ